MNQFFIFPSYSMDLDEARIVTAENKKDAINKYTKCSLVINDSFRDYFLSRCINVSFAEKFWLKTKEDQLFFQETATAKIDEEEFKKRVMEYFIDDPLLGYEYLDYYFDLEKEEVSRELAHFMWLTEFDELDYAVIDLTLIKHID
jgi:hypothetical protein